MPPTFLTPFISFGALSITVAVALLALFARQAGTAMPLPVTPRMSLVLGLVVWLVAAFALGLGSVYVASANSIPTIELGIVTPILVGIGLYLALPGVRELVRHVPHQWLIGLQVYRAGGAIFIVLWGMGLVPGAFAWPAGMGDILIGTTAPLVAIAHMRHGRNAHSLVRTWNLLGLLDLMVALTTGFLTTPSRFQMFAFDAPNLLVTQFPLVIIPTFIVPLSVLLHLASLSRLAQDRCISTSDN
jgi:hypothetical protein